MRKPLLSLLFPLLAACTDSLGVGSDCSAEMRRVRLQEGSPQRVEDDDFAGDHTEQWYYFGGLNGNRTYTFRWGASYESCQVDGPVRFWRGRLDTPQALPLNER